MIYVKLVLTIGSVFISPGYQLTTAEQSRKSFILSMDSISVFYTTISAATAKPFLHQSAGIESGSTQTPTSGSLYPSQICKESIPL
jgi:hypothetical protein